MLSITEAEDDNVEVPILLQKNGKLDIWKSRQASTRETNKAKGNSRLESKCLRAIRLAKVSLCKVKKIPQRRVSPGLFLSLPKAPWMEYSLITWEDAGGTLSRDRILKLNIFFLPRALSVMIHHRHHSLSLKRLTSFINDRVFLYFNYFLKRGGLMFTVSWWVNS